MRPITFISDKMVGYVRGTPEIWSRKCGVGKDEAQEKDMRAEDQGRVEDNLREDEFDPRVHVSKV